MNFEKAEEFIKDFEGCKLEAYADIGGILTIGVGHTGRDVIPGMKITQEQADDILEHDIERIYTLLTHVVPVIYIQDENKINAIISLVFNIGFGNFQKSTLLHKLQGGFPNDDIANEFLRWNKVQGKVIEGLTRRRQAERELFIS